MDLQDSVSIATEFEDEMENIQHRGRYSMREEQVTNLRYSRFIRILWIFGSKNI